MSLTGYTMVILGFCAAQAGYLRVARHMGIIDKPNDRSSHDNLTTVCGAGILFFLAEAVAFFNTGFSHPYFFAGLMLVATVSFMDDLRSLSRRYRLTAQVVGIVLLLYETELLFNDVWIICGLIVMGAGTLNAWNFMDGINGMTAWYGLVCVGTLWGWLERLGLPVAVGGLPFVFIALVVFSTANARRRAVCFAGDVGSISLAFSILFAIIQVIISTRTYLPILLLAVYGTDTVLTILYRLRRGQPIFRAHRLHLFQLLVHKRNWSHLLVSALYALIQLGINALVINAVSWSLPAQCMVAGGVLTLLAGLYVVTRQWVSNG